MSPPLHEPTEAGNQLLVDGVAPITLRDRLALRAAAPLMPKRLQRPLDFGLFDMAARNQLELFATSFRPEVDDVAAVCRRPEADPADGFTHKRDRHSDEGALP